MQHRNRLIAFAALVLVALAVGATLALAASSANGPPQDRIYGGGLVTAGSCTDGSVPFCTPGDRNFSVLAVSSPHGGGAYGTVRTQTFTAQVTCLATSGNTAEIGGVITDGADVGDTLRVFVKDGGGPGTSGDGISPYFIDPPSTPETCTDVGSNALGAGYFVVAHGDVAVENH
jgi:hypothetical protein